MTREAGWDCTGIGMAIPGPFDYRTGTSLMKHKFATLFGVSLAVELRRELRLGEPMPIRFVDDAGAFLLGEAWRGAVRGYGRAMAITLGTGIGSAFMVGEKLAVTATGMPLYSIWNQPYKDGIVEDVVSAIIVHYRKMTDTSAIADVKQIALRAIEANDGAAKQVFAEFGATLGLAIRPIILRFQPEVLVFGGQISKSFKLFASTLREQLRAIAHLNRVIPGASIDFSALYGAARVVWTRDREFMELHGELLSQLPS
jgi:glucokinase